MTYQSQLMKVANARKVGWIGQSSIALFLLVLVCSLINSTVQTSHQGANTATSSLDKINQEFCEGMRKRNSTIKLDVCS